MLEEKVKYLDLRTAALEEEFEDLAAQLQEVSKQLTVYNSHQERFWKEDWPELKKSLSEIVLKIEKFNEMKAIDEQRTALAIQALQIDAAANCRKNQEHATEVKALDWKWLGATAGSSGVIVGLLEIIKSLLPGG